MSERRRTFSLDEAQALLPTVRRVTDEAVAQTSRLEAELDATEPDDPAREQLVDQLNEVIAGWARQIQALDAEVKGLWLVDFDNGEGYYCWRHPEPIVSHYHGYDEGFAGRMKIT